MLESALLAAWKPSHDDWLNDLSSRPPVSVTMHAVKLVAPADELDELFPPPEPLPDPELALAHADVRSASALSAVTTFNVPLTVPPLTGGLRPPQMPAFYPG